MNLSGFKITTIQSLNVYEEVFNLLSAALDELAILIAGGGNDFEIWACDDCRSPLRESDTEMIRTIFLEHGVEIGEVVFLENLYE